MKFRHATWGLIVAGLMLIWPTLGQAQYTTEPIYTTLKVLYGHSVADNFKTEGQYSGNIGKSTGVYQGSDFSSDSFGGGLAIGYDYGAIGMAPVRIELEYLYRGSAKESFDRKNTANVFVPPDLSDLSSRNFMSSSHELNADIHTIFTNIYLDLRNDTGFIPYIGGGFGVAYVASDLESNYEGLLGASVPGAVPEYTHGAIDHNYSGEQHSWNLAWNVGAGFTYYINPSLTMDLGYRYSDYGKGDFGTNTYSISGNVTDASGVTESKELGRFSADAEVEFKSHEVILGLRFTGH